jgi:hypothetical protein
VTLRPCKVALLSPHLESSLYLNCVKKKFLSEVRQWVASLWLHYALMLKDNFQPLQSSFLQAVNRAKFSLNREWFLFVQHPINHLPHLSCSCNSCNCLFFFAQCIIVVGEKTIKSKSQMGIDCLDENPSKMLRSGFCDMSVSLVYPRLMHRWHYSCIRTEFFRTRESGDLSNFIDNQESRIVSNTKHGSENPGLFIFSCKILDLFIIIFAFLEKFFPERKIYDNLINFH